MKDALTLGDWLEIWMARYIWPSRLAHNTKCCYNRAVAAVPPELAAMTLVDLSPLDLLCWLQDVAVQHPRAAQLDRVMLSRALTVASKLRLTSCVVDDDTCPQVVHEAKETVILDYPQLLAYMRAARATDVAPVLLLCCCGLRRGEALGARACDLTPDGVLRVQVQRLHGEELHQLKTRASARCIRLPPDIADCLLAWPPTPSGLICDASAHKVYMRHRAIVRDLSLPPVTLHGLRHSFATAAAMRGEPLKLLQGCLGHASFALTADLYADHLPPVSDVCGHVFVAAPC